MEFRAVCGTDSPSCRTIKIELEQRGYDNVDVYATENGKRLEAGRLLTIRPIVPDGKLIIEFARDIDPTVFALDSDREGRVWAI